MLRFVTLFCALALAASEPQHNIFQIDLDPEVAAQYINSLPFTAPALSARTAVLPLVKYNDPRFRTAEAGPTLGHYWKNGKEIENTDDYVEEVYNAAQFHGQDGLGAYAYGYETPESAKVENKKRSGDVTGEYTFKAGTSNDLIKVRYWADSQGFHQEDNIPKVVLKPVEEAPEVREARIAHEKAWQEAAYANLHPGAAAANAAASQPQPSFNAAVNPGQAQSNYNNPGSNYNFNAAASTSQPQNNYNYNANVNPGQPQTNFNAKLGQPQNYNYNAKYDYQTGASEQQSAYALPPSQLREGKAIGQNQQYYDQQTTTTTTEEPTGPPRGFFYSFTYPVSIIVPKNEQANSNPGYPVDKDTVGVNAYQK